MVVTPSAMVQLGTLAPPFALPDTSGRTVRLEDFRSAPALLVVFMCNHCPYVKHVAPQLSRLTAEFMAKGVAVVGINSNDFTKHPDDSPAAMKMEKSQRGYAFPYLLDESQEVARAYNAQCTPDFFLFDKDRHLVYRGQMDDSRPGNGKPVTGADLAAAVDAVLAGKPPVARQMPSVGCNVKWKP